MIARCADWWRGERRFAPPAFEEASRWIAAAATERLRALAETTSAERIGLYLATSDAGVEASLALWGEALAHGADFANPRAFPWTLASSLAGHIAATAGVRGPVYTLVGGSEAAAAAAAHAVTDLAHGRIDLALLGGADLRGIAAESDDIRAVACVLLLHAASDDAPSTEDTPALTREQTESAAALFDVAITALENGRPARLGSGYEPVVALVSSREERI